MAALLFASKSLFPTNNITLYLDLLLVFIPIFILVPLIYKYWHKRPVKALLTSARTFRWNYMLRAGCVLFIFFGIASFIESIILPSEYAGIKVQPSFKDYIPFLLITLIFVPFQAASEEFLCRGYLNQSIAKYIKAPWVVFILTSAGFAALHIANPEAEGQVWPYLASIFTAGVRRGKHFRAVLKFFRVWQTGVDDFICYLCAYPRSLERRGTLWASSD